MERVRPLAMGWNQPCTLEQDLSYDESLSGRPGTWLVKKIFFSRPLPKAGHELQTELNTRTRYSSKEHPR